MCAPPELGPADKPRQTLLNPTVLLEVLSPSTESDDRGPKLDCYKLCASVRAIILIAQDRIEVTVYERRPEGTWREVTYTDGVGAMPGTACALPLA